MGDQVDSLKAMGRILRLAQGLSEADLRWVMGRLQTLVERQEQSVSIGPYAGPQSTSGGT